MEKQSSLLFSLKRLQKELTEINQGDDIQFSAGLLNESNFFEWVLAIEGPPNTIYDGHLFEAVLNFQKDYPLTPPKMSFLTKMYHPNIFKSGDVCISILNSRPGNYFDEKSALMDENWKPTLGVREIVYSVLSMLTDPNHDSPANSEASHDYVHNFEGYKKKVFRLLRENN